MFKRIKCELEATIVDLEAAAQALKATPQKKGNEPAPWAVKVFEQMMAFTDVRPQRQHYAVPLVIGAGPSSVPFQMSPQLLFVCFVAFCVPEARTPRSNYPEGKTLKHENPKQQRTHTKSFCGMDGRSRRQARITRV